MCGMRVLASERRERLLEVLATDGRVVASEAAGRLGVSLDTVRRDLAELEAGGAVRRVHGGALPARRFVDRREADVPEKATIAAAACGLIRDGQLRLLGGGATLPPPARPPPEAPAAPGGTRAPGGAPALPGHRG